MMHVCAVGECCKEHRHNPKKDVATAVSSFEADAVCEEHANTSHCL